MSKFNTTATTTRASVTSPITSTGKTGINEQGGVGFVRTPQSELFLLAVSDFGGEDTFYEKGSDRLARLSALARKVAVEDLDWTTRFVRWLRAEANMRSSALVVALEGAKALNDAKLPGGRPLVAASMLRADEPGEALGYWFPRYGRKLPKSVKRGIADAATARYNEYSLAKYDAAGRGFRFGDVIDLVHPTPRDAKQSELFKFALDRRRDSSAVPGPSLTQLAARAELMKLSPDAKRELLEKGELSDRLASAGLTWEALSGSLAGGMDAKAWEAVIPQMGYMALLRNLRNFDEAGISNSARKAVASVLTDPEQVAKSRQLPFRFMSAYMNAPSDFWKPVVNDALEQALSSIPVLEGDTEFMIDTSGSMGQLLSARGTVTCAQAASLFGIAFAKRMKRERVFGFDSRLHEFKLKKGADVLDEVKRFQGTVRGGATYTATCAAALLAQRASEGKGSLRRLVVLSDEQIGESGRTHYWSAQTTEPALPQIIPTDTMLYTFNLGGYAYGHAESGMKNRHSFAGLNDSGFKMIPLIEAGRNASWPWEK